ncbi:hypothetical protein OMP38_14940 [Cohnella ginsengisoli]|uniref:Uncharacterized protein n=1 Tax=Cohnella ginsengisoli TaxID=425004 RepID=A0A9X4KH03_9BACL|nr:hypothetical protein [Cohnella ginsengisoli]MDG0792012.1 hypothetical protein [Cohnella ginsengisoli]
MEEAVIAKSRAVLEIRDIHLGNQAREIASYLPPNLLGQQFLVKPVQQQPPFPLPSARLDRLLHHLVISALECRIRAHAHHLFPLKIKTGRPPDLLRRTACASGPCNLSFAYKIQSAA